MSKEGLGLRSKFLLTDSPLGKEEFLFVMIHKQETTSSLLKQRVNFLHTVCINYNKMLLWLQKFLSYNWYYGQQLADERIGAVVTDVAISNFEIGTEVKDMEFDLDVTAPNMCSIRPRLLVTH